MNTHKQTHNIACIMQVAQTIGRQVCFHLTYLFDCLHGILNLVYSALWTPRGHVVVILVSELDEEAITKAMARVLIGSYTKTPKPNPFIGNTYWHVILLL